MRPAPVRPLRLLACLPALLALLAGCASPPDSGAEEVEPVVPVTLVQRGPGVGPDLNATTAQAPRLVEGEWWRIRFTGDFYDPQEVIRVVANATQEGYVFGMPHSGWLKEAIVYHAPAFGDVGLDLSYAVHNERFEPVRFPLEKGATWETLFAMTPYTAVVESADDHVAEITLTPPPSTDPTATAICALGMPCDFAMRLTYDARMHEVVRMESPLGTWEVVEHGFEFRGWVTVPDAMHTAIDYGVFGPSTDNPLPTRTVSVDDRFNRITLLHAVFALSPGAFRITSTAPTGESLVTQHIGGAGGTFGIHELADPGGEWTQEDLAVGAGGTYTMGIAYEQYDILVPDGARRPTHGHEVVR